MKTRFFAVCTASLLMTGCFGSGGGEEPTYPVTGKITMNGSPVAGALVTFSPRGDQPSAQGRTNSQGEYSLTTYASNDGAAEGEYVVLVAKHTGTTDATPEEETHDAVTSGGAPAAGHGGGGGGGGDTDEGGSLLPERYASQTDSGLDANVTPDGDNKFDFDLQP